jgi:hypothetical protein
MDQIKRYGQALGGSPTTFDEEVEKHLGKIEANKRKMRTAKTVAQAKQRHAMHEAASDTQQLPAPTQQSP